MADTVYGPSTVKRRRRTNIELSTLDDAIVEAVRAEHPVTLRGVYYRVVSAGAVEKTEAAYRLVGRQLLKLRRSGTIPYSWITDGTRWISKPDTWTDLDEMLEDASASYRRALWHNQSTEVQIYSEKDAITGVILPVTRRWDVALGVTRGYASESYAWSVAESIHTAIGRGKDEVYLYDLGDHDPSGVDSWRAFEERVREFLVWLDDDEDDLLDLVTFERLAVTPGQIALWNLPTRPTKSTDTRSAGWRGGSVEVDAIPPSKLRELVERAITEHVDPDALRLTQIAERSEREILLAMKGRRGPVGHDPMLGSPDLDGGG